MKVLWIKLEKDRKSFRMLQSLGFDVISLKDDEDIDKKIDESITDNYNTIILSNSAAGFSQKINNEYLKNRNVNIIISKDNDKIP